MSYYTFFYPTRGYNNPKNDSINVIRNRKRMQSTKLEKFKALISAIMIDAFYAKTDDLDRIYDKLSFYVNAYVFSKDSIEKDDWALTVESLFTEAEKEKKDKVDYAINHFRYEDEYDLDEVIENFDNNICFHITDLLILCRIKPSDDSDTEDYLSSTYIEKINDIFDSIDEEIDNYNSCKFYKEFWSTKKDESELYDENKVNNNGYEYVDLGLPSGTLWATMNVGASKPSDFGLYFQWGDTKGYTKEQIEKEKQFDWANYKFSIDGSSSNFSKYKTTGATLELADDAANANMGGDWHMPTPEQIRELINTAYTTNAWTTQDGVYGRLFTSKNNGNSIFIPAAGYAWNGSLYDVGSGGLGNVWSSVLSTFSVSSGQSLDFYSGRAYLGGYGSRYYGFSVRGVI